MLIGLFVLIGFVGVLVGAFAASTGGLSGPTGAPFGGTAAAVLVLVFGLLYLSFIAGFMYLGVGIYDNTRRSAEALERISREQLSSATEAAVRKEPTF